MMFPNRPNPFTSFEGCLLSQTLWGVLVMIGFFGGAMIGTELGSTRENTISGALLGMTLLGFVPWRRWLAAWLRRRNGRSDGPDAPPTG